VNFFNYEELAMKSNDIQITGNNRVAVLRTQAFALTNKVAALLTEKMKLRGIANAYAQLTTPIKEDPSDIGLLIVGVSPDVIAEAVEDLRQDFADGVKSAVGINL
jgi:hypothetical protein